MNADATNGTAVGFFAGAIFLLTLTFATGLAPQHARPGTGHTYDCWGEPQVVKVDNAFARDSYHMGVPCEQQTTIESETQ